MTGDRQHHLLLAPHEILKPREFACQVAAQLERTIPDETVRLRYCGGWLLRGGDEQELAIHLRASEALDLRCRTLITEGPPEPPLLLRVVEATLGDGTITVSTPHGKRSVPLAAVSAVDLGIIGRPQGSLPPKEAEMKRHAEAMLIGLKQGAQRQGLIESGLKRPNPVLAVATRDWPEILVIERGTRFPDLAAAGGEQAIDNLLDFIDRIAPDLDEAAILPGFDRFWRQGVTEGVIRHRFEEHLARHGWLYHWYSCDASSRQ
ncbi:MAG TPA: hypothetical protein EYN79_04820 [Planctomycetes bacterium]|nr:hypothetical protein [Planctomycetota bacterium]